MSEQQSHMPDACPRCAGRTWETVTAAGPGDVTTAYKRCAGCGWTSAPVALGIDPAARRDSMSTFVHGSEPFPRCRCGELARSGVDAAFDPFPVCGECARVGRY